MSVDPSCMMREARRQPATFPEEADPQVRPCKPQSDSIRVIREDTFPLGQAALGFDSEERVNPTERLGMPVPEGFTPQYENLIARERSIQVDELSSVLAAVLIRVQSP